MNIGLPRSKRSIAVIVIILLLISSLWAQIFVTLETDVGVDVHQDEKSLQLMAADYNSEGDRVLQRDGGVLKLDLGEWITGTSKTYTAAFAIVNPAEQEFDVNRVSLAGEPDNLQIHLHRHMTKPSDPGLVNVEDVEEDQDTMLYYDNGTVNEFDDGWTLGSGYGYDEDGNLEYGYSDDEQRTTASLEDGVWVYDSEGPREAEEQEANFVWVEMSVTSSEEDEASTYRGPMEIEIEGEYTAGPSITFMGAGRLDGGPVIRAIEGNSIRLSATDLKADTTVVIPDAFALVNTASTEYEVTNIDVQGDENGYMRVHLHSDPNTPAGDYDALDIEPDDSAITYYDGQNQDPEEYWTIGEGFGYDENYDLLYGDEQETTPATRTSGYPTAEYNMWMYDPEGNNIADQQQSNFVWVEIAYEIPDGVDPVSVDSTINFQLSST